jgi:hypothetical protein
MPKKRSDVDVSKMVELRRKGFTVRQIAKEFGIHHSNVVRNLKNYAPEAGAVGEPPPNKVNEVIDRTDLDGSVEVLKADKPMTIQELMAACNLDPKLWIPQYFTPNSWEGFYKLKDGNGHKKVKLYQTKLVCKRVITAEIEEAIVEFTKAHVKPLPKPTRAHSIKEGFAVSWGIWDAHIGMYAWNSEVGEDFDINMAVNRVFNSIDDMIEELKIYPIEKIWMPIGNDFIHFDSVKNTTTFGEHFLDTDTRYAKVFCAALKCLAYMVERALEITNDLELLYIPGNHDYTSSYALLMCLAQRFLKDPRVKVDNGANPRKYRMHGGTLLCWDHGDTKKIKHNQMNLIYAQETRDVWSQSTYREVQVGHHHQRSEKNYAGVIPTNGILIRTNPSLCNVDAWHHSKGLIGEPTKSVESWRYDRTGYRGSHVTWARDDENRKRKTVAVK